MNVSRHGWIILKSVSYRGAAFVVTAFSSLIFTGSRTSALEISVLELGVKVVLNWMHDLVWLRLPFGRNGHEDTKYRSLLKAMSWRLFGSLATVIIALIVTRKLELAFSIGFVEAFTKIFLYFVHERLWQKILLKRKRRAERNLCKCGEKCAGRCGP